MVRGMRIEQVVIVGWIRGTVDRQEVAAVDLCKVRWILSQTGGTLTLVGADSRLHHGCIL